MLCFIPKKAVVTKDLKVFNGNPRTRLHDKENVGAVTRYWWLMIFFLFQFFPVCYCELWFLVTTEYWRFYIFIFFRKSSKIYCPPQRFLFPQYLPMFYINMPMTLHRWFRLLINRKSLPVLKRVDKVDNTDLKKVSFCSVLHFIFIFFYECLLFFTCR